MIIKFTRKVAHLIRLFLGTEQITKVLDYQATNFNRQLLLQNIQISKVTSYLEFATVDEGKMKASRKFQNIQNLIPLLSPMDILGANYRRFGRDGDGGYVMLDDFASRKIDAAYSFGISDDVSWDEDIANLGINVFMYDHTIQDVPKNHPRFRFFKQGVSGEADEGELETLHNLLVRNGHQNSKDLILKMDIEGCEWGVFEKTSIEVIGQFSQIVIEMHGLDPGKSNLDFSKLLLVLRKIHLTHQSIHVHANGSCPVTWIGELVLPHLLEVTYVRRDDYAERLVENTREFPTEIDQPTFPWLPDIFLGKFSTTVSKY